MTRVDGADALVRSAFEDLKADDARSLPSFAAVLAPRPSRHIQRRSSPMFWLAATGVAIAATLLGYRATAPRDHTLIVARDVSALVAWRPATDVLMPSPAMLIGPRPSLGRSILDSLP